MSIVVFHMSAVCFETAGGHIRLLLASKALLYKANPKGRAGFYLSSISVIFLLVNVQQASQTKVRDLDVVGRLDQDVSGSQVSVNKPPLLQIHHTLQYTHTQTHKKPF